MWFLRYPREARTYEYCRTLLPANAQLIVGYVTRLGETEVAVGRDVR